MLLADGGAIADWTLVVNIAAALGTVGATLAAVFIAKQARDDVRDQRTAQSQAAAHKVLAAIGLTKDRRIVVHVVNACASPITDVEVVVVLRADPKDPKLRWQWDSTDGGSTPRIPYMLSGQTLEFAGSLWPDIHPPSDVSYVWEVVQPRVRPMVVWRDPQGLGWTREAGDEPQGGRPANRRFWN